MSGWRIADHYQTLGVARTASAAELRRAYLRLAREHHPDSVPESERAAAAAKMGKINAAWAVLGDARQRRIYDGGDRSSSAGSPPGQGRASRVYAAGSSSGASTAPHVEPEHHVSTPGCAMLSPLPLLVVFGLLGAIYIFTAYAASSDSPGDRAPVLSGRTDVAAYQLGGCVSYYEQASAEPIAVAVPCDGGHDAIIRRVGPAAVACGPDESADMIPETDVPLCLVPFAG